MKYSFLLAAALLAVPSIASANSRCTLHETNGTWTYYSVAGGSSPYTITCALNIASGTISGGQCVSSSGQTLTASGSLSIATTASPHHGSQHMQRPLSAVKHTACTFAGTITYAENSVTETLTNLSIAHDRLEIFGVGTNGTGLLSVTFVNAN
jgi:hypothetical protein